MEFAVTSKSFSLYKAFKEEAEKAGWVYDYAFNGFTEQKINVYNCLFFTSDWNGEGAKFSFSNSGKKTYTLETQWSEAVEAINELDIEDEEFICEVSLQEIADWKGVSIESIRLKP